MGPLLYARCLGEPLLLDRHRVPVKLRVRKHLALVLFLVVEPRHRASRERLKRMFWPEGKSSQSLSQAISEIRVALGTDVFDVSEHYLGLKPGIPIERDLDLLSSGDADLLLRELSNSFWGHVLFDGMEFEDAEEWNTWLQVERGRWTERIAKAFSEAAESAKWKNLHDPSLDALLKYWRARFSPSPQRKEKASEPDALELWAALDTRVEQHLSLVSGGGIRCVSGARSIETAVLMLAAFRRLHSPALSVGVESIGGQEAIRNLIAELLKLPGSSGVSPEVMRELRACVSSGGPALSSTAVGELLATICEERALSILVGGPIPVELSAALQRIDETRHPVLLAHIGPPTGCSECAERSRLEPSRALEGSAAASLASILAHQTRWTGLRGKGDTTLEAHPLLLLAGLHHAGARASRAVGRMVAEADQTSSPLLSLGLLPTHISALRNELSSARSAPQRGVRKSTPQKLAARLVDPNRAELLVADSEPAREALLLSLEAGSVSENDANAVLLAVGRTSCTWSPQLAAQAMSARLAVATNGGEPLSSIERLAYYFLCAIPAVGDVVLPFAVADLSHWIDSPRNASEAAAGIILASTLRDDAMVDSMQREMLRLSRHGEKRTFSVEWIARFRATVAAVRRGDYVTSGQLANRLYLAAAARGRKSAESAALRTMLVGFYRLGRYADVLAIGNLLGSGTLRTLSRTLEPYTLHVAAAAKMCGDKAMYHRAATIAEEAIEEGKGPRAKLMAAELARITRRESVARRAAEEAAESSMGRPLLGQEGLWMNTAGQVMETPMLEQAITALLENPHSLDARDLEVARRVGSQRGLRICIGSADLPRTERLPESALI